MHLDYTWETEGHVYPDTVIIDRRWKFINRDGSRDRRFKYNVELPVVRCGILGLKVADYPIGLMTTNPDAPEMFNSAVASPQQQVRRSTVCAPRRQWWLRFANDP